MGLKADVDEVVSAWERAPWRVRLYIGISLLLASTSIASLSESIFKWKGFILDGVNLYRSFISIPSQDLIAFLLERSLPQRVVDLLLLAVLLAAASIRVALFHPKGSNGRKAEIAAVVSLGGAMITLIASNGNGFGVWMAGILLAASFLMNASFHIRLGGAPALLWFVYLLVPFALVGVLGAFHAGLAR